MKISMRSASAASLSTTGFTRDVHDFLATYEIDGAPYNQPLYVTVEPGALFQADGATASQIAGPRPAVLTIAQSVVNGVDFRITGRSVH